MPAATVVPGLDPVEDTGAEALDGARRLPAELLDLQRSEQAHAHRVVERVPRVLRNLPVAPELKASAHAQRLLSAVHHAGDIDAEGEW